MAKGVNLKVDVVGLQQRNRGLPLCSTPSAPGFCLSHHQATISQHSSGTDTDVQPNRTTLKGFPSLSKLIQGNSNHGSTALSPLTSVKTETLAVPETTVSLAEIAAQHLSKDKDLRSFKTVSSGGLLDLSRALPPLLSPSHLGFNLTSLQATISHQPPGANIDVPPELFQDHSNPNSSVIKALTCAKATTVVESIVSFSELIEHLSMDTDLTLIFLKPLQLHRQASEQPSFSLL